jgi:hypothetical protein
LKFFLRLTTFHMFYTDLQFKGYLNLDFSSRHFYLVLQLETKCNTGQNIKWK